MSVTVGSTFPEDVSFMYIPYTPEKAGLNACGLPVKYNASKGMSTSSLSPLSLSPLSEGLPSRLTLRGGSWGRRGKREDTHKVAKR